MLMKKSFYIASLVAALLLMVVILIVLDPSFDRQRNMIVIGVSIIVFFVLLAVLVVYPFMKTDYLTRTVKNMGFVSMFLMLALAFSCPPNLEVRHIFTPIDSKEASGN